MHYSILAREQQLKNYRKFLSYNNWAKDICQLLSACQDSSTHGILGPHISSVIELSKCLDQAIYRVIDVQKRMEIYAITAHLFRIKSDLVGRSWDREAGLVKEAVFLIDSMLTETLLFMHEKETTYYEKQVKIMEKDFEAQPEDFFSDAQSKEVFHEFFKHAKDLATYLDIYRTPSLDKDLKRALALKKRELLSKAWGALIRHAGPRRGSAEKAGDLAEAMFKDTQVALDLLS